MPDAADRLAHGDTRDQISHAEFARFVQEAREQRERADALAAALAASRARERALVEALTPVTYVGGPGSGVVERQCSVCGAEWYGGAADVAVFEHRADCLLAAGPVPEEG